MESNFNHHGRWTFCLLQQFAQAVLLFLLDELAYPAFYPLPDFLTFKKKYYHISINCDAPNNTDNRIHCRYSEYDVVQV